jgi:hypothetical protein
MRNPFRRRDNAWVATDRSERVKTVLLVVAFFAAVAFGIGLLVYSFTHH